MRQRQAKSGVSGRNHDEVFDSAPNAWITTTFIDGELASVLRVHVADDENGQLPSLDVFSDIVMPHLRAGHVIIDATRPTADLEFAARYPELPYIALRPAWLAAQYFEADFILATVSEQHAAFYQRAFGYSLWSEPREIPHFDRDVVCVGLDVAAAKERLEARYPFLRSTWAERNALFGRASERRSRMF